MASLNRTDFQILAVERLEDAKALASLGRYAAAFYLAGYSIECALKACIAKRIQAGDWPPKPKVVQNEYYSHDLSALLKAAGLDTDLKSYAGISAVFAKNWATVLDWTEERRYETAVPRQQADEMIAAIEDATDGILPWLRTHY